eukprot:2129679-Pyramimonas_sp.AAC.1
MCIASLVRPPLLRDEGHGRFGWPLARPKLALEAVVNLTSLPAAAGAGLVSQWLRAAAAVRTPARSQGAVCRPAGLLAVPHADL